MDCLIHIRPPGDTGTVAIRNLIRDQNITNAAILFDDEFGNNAQKVTLYINITIPLCSYGLQIQDTFTKRACKTPN